MAPRSPRMTFEPTPALEENKENFSPFNRMNDAKYSDFNSFDNERQSRSVHFFDPSNADMPIRRSQSIATTTVPLLPSVSSASQLPKQSSRRAAAPEVDINAYFEHSRSLLESLRLNHERDKTAFDEERRLWNTERSVLKARIADLEFKLNKSSSGKRRYSNDSTTSNAQSFRSDFGSFSSYNLSKEPRSGSVPTTNGGPPVWEGPKQAAVTRVFSNESDQGNPAANHLTSISEDEASVFTELSREISPTSILANHLKSEPVSIDKIDSTLDGITLRSRALAPSFVPRVLTPTQNASPAARSPSPNARLPRPNSQSPPSDPNGHTSLSLNMNSLLSPLDEKLKRHAGHTPMAFDGTLSTEVASTEVPTPREERPPAPAPTKRPPLRPSENSDTYFSFQDSAADQEEAPVLEKISEVVDTEGRGQTESGNDDPGLSGPLMLDPNNKSGSSNEFLDLVDAKLMEAAMAERKESVLSSSDNGTTDPPEESKKEKDEVTGTVEAEKDYEMPKLRMKKSMNFGSAYGSSKPGSQW